MSEESAQNKAEEKEVNEEVPTSEEGTSVSDETASTIEQEVDKGPSEAPESRQNDTTETSGEGEETEANEKTGNETNEETPEEMEKRFKAELAEKDDKHVRLLAEFENFKRRSTQEMQSRFKFASQSLSLSIISGLDNLERAIDQAKEDSDNEQLQEFVAGIEMAKQQFYEAFEKNNIERIYPKGELFDPNKHEAMGVVETDAVQPDHVAEVFQAGYLLHDRVIRPAMVQVSKKK